MFSEAFTLRVSMVLWIRVIWLVAIFLTFTNYSTVTNSYAGGYIAALLFIIISVLQWPTILHRGLNPKENHNGRITTTPRMGNNNRDTNSGP